ncbi:hypothetical protein G6F56_000717 [Rhizopus delemar]|nr:hypothetical protein G6F56_000717 [Rhizopus delemar]
MHFLGLKIAKTAVHDFMANEDTLTIKKAHFEPKERNSPENITAGFNWPKTKAKTTTNLGAISSQDIFNINMRVLYEESSKKRKVTREPKAKKTVGTVLSHYFNFISATLDVLDRHEQFKGHCLIMDNTPIYNLGQIAKVNCKSQIWMRISSTILSRA